jgi:hypothetical protein
MPPISHEVPEDRWQEVDASAPHALSFVLLVNRCLPIMFLDAFLRMFRRDPRLGVAGHDHMPKQIRAETWTQVD